MHVFIDQWCTTFFSQGPQSESSKLSGTKKSEDQNIPTHKIDIISQSTQLTIITSDVLCNNTFLIYNLVPKVSGMDGGCMLFASCEINSLMFGVERRKIASRLSLVSWLQMLLLFSFICEKACSQQYVLPNMLVWISALSFRLANVSGKVL